MNCIETKKNIGALLDGELDGALKDVVENHLLICRACCELKEEMILLSSFLRTSEITPPSDELDKRVMTAFRNHQPSVSWRRVIFGAFVIPKPAFAMLLILAATASWLAFQIGKINSTTISMTSPSVVISEIPVPTPTQTIVVEVPVIKEKIVTRTVFVREQKNNKNEKAKLPAASKQNSLPSSSSVADNGYFTDVSLKGFQPTAEMNAKIIKEEKKDEK
ncbi:MAG: zf-HC2 domain-containing protein [Acidobacteria bacterium]|nr:zf-HC2 domain-containing protein [Acidobacteriota bacterium]